MKESGKKSNPQSPVKGKIVKLPLKSEGWSGHFVTTRSSVFVSCLLSGENQPLSQRSMVEGINQEIIMDIPKSHLGRGRWPPCEILSVSLNGNPQNGRFAFGFSFKQAQKGTNLKQDIPILCMEQILHQLKWMKFFEYCIESPINLREVDFVHAQHGLRQRIKQSPPHPQGCHRRLE